MPKRNGIAILTKMWRNGGESDVRDRKPFSIKPMAELDIFLKPSMDPAISSYIGSFRLETVGYEFRTLAATTSETAAGEEESDVPASRKTNKKYT